MSYFKYPRTYHLPFSKCVHSDDKEYEHNVDSIFNGKQVVVTAKMDGENSTLYHDGHTHARSLDSANHPSRNWLKGFWSERSYLLPSQYRVCGENLFAKHSINYNDLPSYFMAFSIYNRGNNRLDWDDFVLLCGVMGVDIVPTLKVFTYNNSLKLVESIFEEAISNGHEGIVLTTKEGFHYNDFSKFTTKAVREAHVQVNDDHWMHKQIIKNGLKT